MPPTLLDGLMAWHGVRDPQPAVIVVELQGSEHGCDRAAKPDCSEALAALVDEVLNTLNSLNRGRWRVGRRSRARSSSAAAAAAAAASQSPLQPQQQPQRSGSGSSARRRRRAPQLRQPARLLRRSQARPSWGPSLCGR
jgi:hypothetical protein